MNLSQFYSDCIAKQQQQPHPMKRFTAPNDKTSDDPTGGWSRNILAEEISLSTASSRDPLAVEDTTDEAGGFGKAAVGNAENDGSADVAETNDWRAIWITFGVAILCSVEASIVSIGEWPYMQQMDPDATVQFKGVSQSLSQAMHAIAVVFFGLWQHRFQHSKWPMIAGRVIAYVGIVLYLAVELFPTNRRFVMMFCGIFFTVSQSSTTVLRAYAVSISSREMRAKIFALLMLAAMLSIIISPLTQLAFSGIPYPGAQILPGILFHVYSAPVWLALLTNTIALIVIACLFKDPPRKPRNLAEQWSLERLKRLLRDLVKMPFSWPLVAVCLFSKTVDMFNKANLQSLMQPLVMVVYGWSGLATVRLMSVCMAAVGVCAIAVTALFVLCRLAERIHLSILFLVSTLAVLGMYILTYPFPSYGTVIAAYNETTRTGCNPEIYSWCEGTAGPPVLLLITTMGAIMGISMPVNVVSIDTLYSKILGDVDQSLMQAIFVLFQDIPEVFIPLLTTYLFTAHGVGTVWLVAIGVISSGVVVWVGALRWLLRYK